MSYEGMTYIFSYFLL